jgi:hypothetical protein
MAKGGKRVGAGRKKGLSSMLSEAAHDYIAKRVVEEQEPLIQAQLKKAKKGDTFAFNALYDRGFGRPKQTSDVTVRESKPFDDVKNDSVQKDKEPREED